MAGEPFYEPINLLVLAENATFRNTFIEDLKGFLQNGKYKPEERKVCEYNDNTIFKAQFREFRIISGPVLNGSDSPIEVSSKFLKTQNHFIQPLKLNAIIFLMQADPKYYEHFLSVSLFSNFSKEDVSKIEKNVMFVFTHNEPVHYEKRDLVDAALWTILDRIGADLMHSKTFHCHSRLDKDFQEGFWQFIYTNKKTLMVETVYSHESVLKLIGNEDFLDLLLEALILNEDNIHYKSTDKLKEYCLMKRTNYLCKCTNQNCLQICCLCPEITTKSNLKLCDALINNSDCTKCKCSINDHEAVKYSTYLKDINLTKTEQLKKYRRSLIAIVVVIDMFHGKNNEGVDQLYDRLKEKIKKESRYSVLETLYKNEVSCLKKEIKADDCMKCLWKLLPSLKGFKVIEEELENSLLLSKRNLCVSVETRKSAKLE